MDRRFRVIHVRGNPLDSLIVTEREEGTDFFIVREEIVNEVPEILEEKARVWLDRLAEHPEDAVAYDFDYWQIGSRS